MTSKVFDLRRKIKRLETLIDTSMVFSGILDIDELLDTVMQKAEEVMEAEASSVFRIDEKRKDLYFITARGEKGKEAKEIRVPMGKGIVGWVAEHGKPLLVPDVRKDSRWFRGVDEKTKWVTRSILAVPLIVKGKVIGVAEVLNKKGDRKFDKGDLELFAALGNQIAIAVENASLYSDLDKLFLSSIRAIVEAVDAKDPYTRGHSGRVVEYALQIGHALTGNKDKLKEIEISAILHDVGKIGIPDKILGKPGRLTRREQMYMERHPEFSAAIVEPIELLKKLRKNILHHHERIDGAGYPNGLIGSRIPLVSRIICIADAFDAMTTDRPYRKRKSTRTALRELKRHSGSQFDERLVDIFVTELANNNSL
ncbi:MAG: GAF domain-containing protein [candidate division WOR-3 bacterium]|nr:MAG: GAF domain-containing protein [candidate division WOR-3 bacterium]